MNQILVGAGVVNQTALDIEGNTRRILEVIQHARKLGCQLLCLPELCLTGYGCEDVFLSREFRQLAERSLQEIIDHSDSILVSVGLPLEVTPAFSQGGNQVGIFNCCAVIANGRLEGVVAKQNLARDGLHYEPRWFRAWPGGESCYLEVLGESVPFGDLVFAMGKVGLGFEICEDAWVDDRPAPTLLDRGANIIFNPSASHFAFDKNLRRQKLIRDVIDQSNVNYLYANLLGNEAGRAIYDGDAYIATGHQIRARADRFSYREWGLITSPIEIIEDERLPPSRVMGNVVTDFRVQELSESLSATADGSASGWESGDSKKEEEFARAVSLGLFDYIRKSRSGGVVISLSGGADSAAVTCLSRLAIEFALLDIGVEGLQQKFSHVEELEACSTSSEFCQQLIATVYQATEHSGPVTRQAASDVATGCFTEHHEFEIGQIVEQYEALVSRALERPLDWNTDDIARQNIQARVRSPGVWMIANIRNALLLSTSNRSEAAVGYATMDGDTSGGLAPIAGIDKAFLRRWLLWMQLHAPEGMAPFAFLESVNCQQPTAELRPAGANQTDESDLMPYSVLDRIERAAIRDRLLPQTIVDRLVGEYPKEKRAQIIEWVRRFFRLWSRNQWKRERYAPSFHVDDANLDPKTWCRFPILSGGFEQLLRELN